MTDLALQIAGSKLALSVVLGGVVWLAARGDQRPRLCHALCLALLLALLVPPLFAIPLLRPDLTAAVSADPVLAEAISAIGTDAPAAVVGDVEKAPWLVRYGKAGFVPFWLLGVAVVVGWTIVRAQSFRRFLRGASREAPATLQRDAREVADVLGLATVPAIYTTDTVISPMVCWSGGAVRVYIPSALLNGMEPAQSRWILAHELAHVRRSDHIVRWLEWLACTVFWWNPVAWWTRRRLRSAEEVCCDATVVRAFDCSPRAYARALMRAIDLVRTGQVPRFAAFTSAAGSDRPKRMLERRLRMIMATRPNTTRTRVRRLAMRGGFVAVLALGLVYCGEQRSPTALELADEDLDRIADYVTRPLSSLLSPVAQDRRWAGRVPRDADDVLIEAHDLRTTSDGEYTVPELGLILVGYDQRVPYREQEALWAAIAQLTASEQNAEFLVARQMDGGEWTFLDKVPEASSSTLHLISPGA
ncbi:MAG: M56 family metallopeptidase [Gemmatimonadota bacterium]|nr:M56 family metallopeptidase [Gemmatimonadota bacterium]MDE2863484.1 M56 family metallopeptidase [Gemmatimonadota bacterium]MYB04793.1 M56 family metallopeptidase [Gemmatimonadota bacterium]MYG23673.1 M56 family metallopeptidase [Gemmatimonadota bacterium]MYJ39490.1 M56 family metallopeptidase [Gemmatimonadota bacterium]